MNSSGVFKIHNGDWYWNMQGGATGMGFCSYNVAGDTNNNLLIWRRDAVEDLYGLNQKSYGLMTWTGTPLPGAVFSMQYGKNVSLFDTETKTSDENGLIAQVYLQENETYTLTELQSPQGYIGLKTPLEIGIEATASGWKLNVEPEIPAGDPLYYEVTYEDGIITLTVKNHPYDLKMVKVDDTNRSVPVAGAVFSLYKQQKIDQTETWDEEHPVYVGLTTGADGVVPHIDKQLPAGTYQLRETKAPDGYEVLSRHTDFTVSAMGTVTLGNHPDGVELTQSEDESGTVTYSICIPNKPQPLKLKKTDEDGNPLAGAKFSLSQWDGTTLNSEGKRMWNVMADPLTGYNDIDMTDVSETELASLPSGYYRLKETLAPSGYIITQPYFYFVIKPNREVWLCEEDGTGEAKTIGKAAVTCENSVYTIIIKNTPGTELPNTGGPGSSQIYLLGCMLMGIAGAGFVLKQKRRKAA